MTQDPSQERRSINTVMTLPSPQILTSNGPLALMYQTDGSPLSYSGVNLATYDMGSSFCELLPQSQLPQSN